MTDIQHHLKEIRKLLQTMASQTQWEQTTVIDRLRALLPVSYGITGGVVFGANAESLSLPIVVYDAVLAGNTPEQVRIEHTLLIIEFVEACDGRSFQETLERVASLKKLKIYASQRKAPDYPPELHRKVPKDRIPYTLILIGKFQVETNSQSLLQVGDLTNSYPAEQRPDEIIVRDPQWHYLNPLLHYTAVQPTDRGWGCTPNHAKPQVCYICKMPFVRRHFFYQWLCVRCADLNYTKRTASADLRGRIALVTGARVKIGYAVGLRLLRAGAEVIAVSRFPNDTARRYAQEPDFPEWSTRLHIYALDLRQARRLQAFIDHLYERFPHLDILINNAAQTVKRPPAYYAHLLPFENREMLPAHLSPLVREFAETLSGHIMPALPEGEPDPDFPPGEMDTHGEQIDNRPVNSWMLTLDQVSFSEILEVHLINAVAPAVLAGQLKALMLRSPHPNRYIINVSAAEGRFAAYKAGEHPHTNMAKAALNMLTRTIASDYAATGIYVNSIDPGWVSDQTPHENDASRAAVLQLLPIDMTDAAARLCDPIFENATLHGKMLKDYQEVNW